MPAVPAQEQAQEESDEEEVPCEEWENQLDAFDTTDWWADDY